MRKSLPDMTLLTSGEARSVVGWPYPFSLAATGVGAIPAAAIAGGARLLDIFLMV